MDKEFLLSELHAGPVKLKFRKADGELREMTCTLNESYLPERQEDNLKQTRKENPDVQSVWDLEKQAWRSFKWSRLLIADEDKGL